MKVQPLENYIDILTQKRDVKIKTKEKNMTLKEEIFKNSGLLEAEKKETDKETQRKINAWFNKTIKDMKEDKKKGKTEKDSRPLQDFLTRDKKYQILKGTEVDSTKLKEICFDAYQELDIEKMEKFKENFISAYKNKGELDDDALYKGIKYGPARVSKHMSRKMDRR